MPWPVPITADLRETTLLSVRAFSDVDFPDGVDESWPVRPDGHQYVDTKVAGEQVVLQAPAAGEVDATVVRPGTCTAPVRCHGRSGRPPAWAAAPSLYPPRVLAHRHLLDHQARWMSSCRRWARPMAWPLVPMTSSSRVASLSPRSSGTGKKMCSLTTS